MGARDVWLLAGRHRFSRRDATGEPQITARAEGRLCFSSPLLYTLYTSRVLAKYFIELRPGAAASSPPGARPYANAVGRSFQEPRRDGARERLRIALEGVQDISPK